MAAEEAPPCLGFSSQEHLSGLPFTFLISNFRTVTYLVPEPNENVKLFEHLINRQHMDKQIFQLKVAFAQV